MRFRLFTVFAAAGLLLAGCALEEAPMEGGSIAAVMEDIQTRTAVTDEGIFTWSSGDKVWLEITANPGYVTGTLSTGAGTGSANFSYGTYFGDMTGKAIYPFNTGHDISGDQLSVVLPATYDLGSNLGNTNAAMYGVETSGKVKFNHLAGVMRFNFRSVPAGVNKFVITLDKKINGTFTADLTEDHPVLQTESTSDESEKTITLNFDDLTQTQDINIYVPLPLGTYTTLELALMDDDETVWNYSNTITNTVNRKSLLLMPTVNVTGSISGDLEGGDVVEGENPSDPQEGDYVDEYGINHGQGVEIDGVIWAPVNCGYHETDYKYGKLYQWGRKYGQGYDSNDATVPSIVRGPEDFSVVQQESNSNKFYSSMNSDFDWIYGGSRSLLWNSGSEENPIKTEYDPCPDGWRVPTYSEIGALKANSSSWTTNDGQNGYWFSGSNTYSESVHSVFLPAAGYRLCGDGSVSGTRGTGGDYWSSSPNNNDTYYLSFSSGGLVNVSYYHRASGYSVRCVHEDSMLDVPEEPSGTDAVDLSAAGTANSYIVSEAGSYKFTPTKGNSSTPVGTISSVAVLWESFGTSTTPSVGSLISEASYEDGCVFFSTPESFREGNAVIAAKDASGTILWSWHIWLTDQPQEQVYYNNAGTMMDRNLGATSATPGDVGALGLLYQWGRKDPFLGSSSISSSTVAKSTITWPSCVSSTSSSGTIAYATEHPTTFITYNSNNYDWYYTDSSSTDNTRWQSDKTIYDPCPVGWRVPDGGSAGIWSEALGSSSSFTREYDITNEGMNFSGIFGDASTIWYPASGYRADYDGSLGPVGEQGYYWSVSLYSDYAYFLYFHLSGNVYPSGYNFRVRGLAVRCVREDSVPDVPEDPSEPDSSQPSYSVQLTPSTYGWQQSTTVPNPDASLYDGVYESTNQGRSSTKSIMYIDIDGYDTFTFYVRSYAESQYDYVIVSNLDVDITNSTSGFKMTTSGNQQSGTSLSSYTEVTFTNIGGGQHRIMVAYKKDHSVDNGNDKGYVLIPKNQNQGSTPEVPSEPQDGDYIDEYGINHGQGVEIDGVVWAPVNCGYHATDYKYGKLYQWGRKYGQGYEGVLWDVNGNQSGTYADASLPSFVSGPVSLSVGQSSSNSNKYYESTSSPWDWVTPQNDELWNSGTETNPVKTEYDPCPEGWRVPTYAELNNLKENYSSWTTHDNQNGLWFSGSASYSQSVSSVFLPAAGYPDINGGDDRGIRGWYWSSRVSDNRACGMDVYYGCANMYEGGRRMDGSSVRCVQE